MDYIGGMNPLLFMVGTLVVLVLVAAFLRPRSSSRVAPEGPPGDDDPNEKFLTNPSGKALPVDLVRTYSPQDLGLLRSLLDAEGIDTYALFSNMGALYPVSGIPGYSDTVVQIHPEDGEAARLVVQDYLSSWTAPDPTVLVPATGLAKPELLLPPR